MKYFMSVWSPIRKARRTFLMSRVSAEYYYGDFLSKFHRDNMKHCFETGARAISENGTRIWGENISDSELFNRRLKGTVDKDMLECPL